MRYPNIEAERARLGLSKEDLAKRLGVTTKTYYNWVKGINSIPSTALECLSEMYKVSTDYLLGRSSA